MTTIFDQGGLWIESLQGARVTVADNESLDQTLTLEKPGKVVCWGGSYFSSQDAFGVMVLKANGSFLEVWHEITQIRCITKNKSGLEAVIQQNVMVFLKA